MDTAIRLSSQPATSHPASASQPDVSYDLERAGAPVAPPGAHKLVRDVGHAAHAAVQTAERLFLKRAEPTMGALTGLHTVSMVVREAFPAYVASPALGIVGGLTKLAASVGGAPALQKTQALAGQVQAASTLSKQYQALAVALLRTAGTGLTLAALGAFPAAESAALAIGALGHAAQQAAQRRGTSRLKRNVLAVACQAAVLLTREGAFNAATNPLSLNVASPYLASAAACNGAAENCVAQWCDVVFPATHNSMMTPVPFATVNWPLNQLGRFASNQARSVEAQFADGIRGFLVEFYQNDKGELRTSHNTVLDREPLATTLGRFARLLNDHPRDFIALQLSQQQKGRFDEQLIAAYEASGLAEKTLRDTCETAARKTIEVPPCRLSMGSLLDLGVQVATIRSPIETTYNANTLSGMSCLAGGFVPVKKRQSIVNGTLYDAYGSGYVSGRVDYRGAKIAPVTWNAFVTLAMPSVSGVVNGYLPNFVAKCAAEGNTDVNTPTLLAVNHYESSDVVAIAHALNTQGFKRAGDEAVCGSVLASDNLDTYKGPTQK